MMHYWEREGKREGDVPWEKENKKKNLELLGGFFGKRGKENTLVFLLFKALVFNPQEQRPNTANYTIAVLYTLYTYFLLCNKNIGFDFDDELKIESARYDNII